ncbi:AroM family protein [Gottfriedia acidiceleris]|uniref:AroM family protein n=1 Tax=Gottfriedia acidiceleris TaxID=371036 RepID=UPI003D1CA0AD
MSKLGMITIGQSPRSDLALVIEKYLEGRAEVVQIGVLDGLVKEAIEKHLSPEAGGGGCINYSFIKWEFCSNITGENSLYFTR